MIGRRRRWATPALISGLYVVVVSLAIIAMIHDWRQASPLPGGVAWADTLGKGDGGAGGANSKMLAQKPVTAAVADRGYDYFDMLTTGNHNYYGPDRLEVTRLLNGVETRVPLALIEVYFNGYVAAAADSAVLAVYDTNGDSTLIRLRAPNAIIRGPWTFRGRVEYARMKRVGGTAPLHGWVALGYCER